MCPSICFYRIITLITLFCLLQTVSFLTYLLKSFADYIRPHEESICKSIVNLLVTCSDSVAIRKVNDCVLIDFLFMNVGLL